MILAWSADHKHHSTGSLIIVNWHWLKQDWKMRKVMSQSTMLIEVEKVSVLKNFVCLPFMHILGGFLCEELQWIWILWKHPLRWEVGVKVSVNVESWFEFVLKWNEWVEGVKIKDFLVDFKFFFEGFLRLYG